MPSLTSSHHAYSASATLASLLLLDYVSHVPASGPLHLLFPLPKTLSPDTHMVPSLISFKSLWHHFLRENFLHPPPNMETAPSGILAPPPVPDSSLLTLTTAHVTAYSSVLVCLTWWHDSSMRAGRLLLCSLLYPTCPEQGLAHSRCSVSWGQINE